VQTAQRLGPALGPVLGGVVAQAVGLRHAFLVAAVFYALGFLLVLFGYREVRPRSEAAKPAAASTGQVTFRSVLAFQNFLLLMGVIFGLQFVDRSFGPVLPLYIASSGVSPSRVALVSGVLFSLAAGAGAAANYFCERLLRWISVRATIVAGASVAACASIVFAAVPVVPALLVAATVFGAGIGVATTAAFTAAGSVIPDAVRGTGFGLLTSAWLAGMALSPVVNGMLGATSIRAVFVLDVVALSLLAVVVLRAMVERKAPAVTNTLA